jgi:hypothetical protein
LENIEKNFFESYDSYDISLGELLRGERATLGKSCLDVQNDLKIKVQYIKAIEKCDVRNLENKSFIAGYVRTYAKYLGLDPNFVYDRFCSESGFISSDLNSFRPEKKRKTEKVSANPINSNFLSLSKFSNNKFKINFSSNLIIKKLLPLCSLFLILFGVSYWTMQIILDIQRLEIIPIDQEPYSSVELQNINNDLFALNNKNFVAKDLNLDNIEKKSLGNLYSTRDEIFPVVQNRDSPISKIDPNSYGLFLKTEKMLNPIPIEKDLIEINKDLIKIEEEKPLVLRPKVPTLKLFAFDKSWIRLKDQKGDIYFERNLKKGEELIIPNELFSGSLRAGNSTKVFFIIDDNIFGPLSNKGSVVKNFSIDPNNIEKNLSFVSTNLDNLEPSIINKSHNLSAAKKID